MKNIYFLITFIILSSISVDSFAQIPVKAEDISPLLIGETLPNTILVDPKGNSKELKLILKNKPTVLVFYRGGWCPYCNLQLSDLGHKESEILDLGYQIVAISPDNYQNLNTTLEKDSINYQLFSDPNGKLLQEVGIAFQTPSMIKGYISKKGQLGEVSEVIPVPTVMVVDTNGVVLFEYINPNYKVRISGELLLAVLKSL